jgi:hypothetical protein
MIAELCQFWQSPLSPVSPGVASYMQTMQVRLRVDVVEDSTPRWHITHLDLDVTLQFTVKAVVDVAAASIKLRKLPWQDVKIVYECEGTKIGPNTLVKKVWAMNVFPTLVVLMTWKYSLQDGDLAKMITDDMLEQEIENDADTLPLDGAALPNDWQWKDKTDKKPPEDENTLQEKVVSKKRKHV